MPVSAITLTIEGQEKRITADTVIAHFLDQAKPVAEQPQQYQKALELLAGLVETFTNPQGEFILGGLVLDQELLARRGVVPSGVESRITEASKRRAGLDLQPDPIHLNFGTNPKALQVDVQYTARYPDFHSMQQDVAPQIAENQQQLLTIPRTPIAGRYDAGFEERWIINPKKIHETSKTFEGYHVHHGGFKFRAEVPEIPLQTAEEPSARAVNRTLALMLGKFTDL